MARLPSVGVDDGNWGTILNDFLSQSLTDDGRLKNDSVGAPQLAPNAVTNAVIAPETITESKLSSGVQTKLNSTDVADGSITSTKLADNSVTTDKLVDDVVSSAKLANNAVTTASIVNGAVLESKLDTALSEKINTTQIALGTKVDRVSNANRVYGTDGSGVQNTYGITGNPTANTIAYRATNGVLAVGTPAAAGHAATKAYVDAVDKTTLGLGNVDNTSDANKPISTATQIALNAAATNIASYGMGTIVHGATATTTRPTGFACITWIGSVQPTNAVTNDIWIYKAS